jgi:hypothetical protein
MAIVTEGANAPMYVHFRERDDASQTETHATPCTAGRAIRHIALVTAHPRTPGVLWEQLGWRTEIAKNIAADIERGAYQRRGWFTGGSSGKAA